MSRTAFTAVVAGILAAITTTASQGADLARPRPYTKAPIYQPVYAPFTWQGFYAGFNGGYGFSDSTVSAGGLNSTVHPDGALLGAGFGYNFQAGNLVYGFEGDADYSWMKDTNGIVLPCPGCEVRNHYFATARGRLGYAFDHWLLYGTGGAAFGDITVSLGGVKQVANNVGWTAGAGVEYAFAATHWSAKVEYLYADLGSMTCDAAHCGIPTDVDLKTNVVRVGLNYHF